MCLVPTDPAPRRPRLYLVKASALSCALTLLLCAPYTARVGTFGSYSGPVYTGGHLTLTPGPGQVPYQSGQGGCGSVGGTGGSASCGDPITATFTWSPAYPGEAAPQSVVVAQTSKATYTAETFGTPSGSCDEGLNQGDAPINDPNPPPARRAAPRPRRSPAAPTTAPSRAARP